MDIKVTSAETGLFQVSVDGKPILGLLPRSEAENLAEFLSNTAAVAPPSDVVTEVNYETGPSARRA